MLNGFWVVAEDGRTKYIDDFCVEYKSLAGYKGDDRILISRHESIDAAERQREDLIEWMKSGPGLVFAETDDSGVTNYAPYIYDVRLRKVKEAQGGSDNEQ